MLSVSKQGVFLCGFCAAPSQIDLMTDEKPPARISHRLFATSRSEMEDNMKKQKNIAVIFGGCSSEYSVSLSSAAAVLKNLDADIYTPVMLGITKSGDWFYYTGSIDAIQNDTWHESGLCTPAVISPNRSRRELLVLDASGISRIELDAAFPVLHGKNGEDGTVQGIIQAAGIPLVGCGVLSSALCMDKERAHRLVSAAGIETAKSLVLNSVSDLRIAYEFCEAVGYPVFVKPVKAGSSYGITKVHTESALEDAICIAFQYDNEVILEENIDGFEVGCAVLGTDELTVGEVDEIELSNGFFDFTEKYTLKSSKIHVPARISPEKSSEIKAAAKLIYRTLGCSVFARVDMFLTPEGKIVFNEVNTIPGFTEHSRYPGMMNAAGYSFKELLTMIIEQGG